MLGIIIMKAQYIEEASKVIPETHVLINMVSRRVRQLSAGSRPLIDAALSLGLADVALLEIAQGKIVLAEPLVDAA
ncbi:MAG: DNA-directed RNA polymerase subunit omega [Pseudomonadota bacterium]